VLLAACTNLGARGPGIDELPPLQLPGAPLPPSEAMARTTTPPLLELNDEMREVVNRYVSGNQRQRLRALHQSLQSPGMVGISYDPAADGTAAEVFDNGAANCLSYAHLFVAMARYAGLDARYLSVSLRPEWTRHGNQLALRKHVNITVRLRNGEEYVVDIDPVARSRVASADVLSDREAQALYHGNIAMDALLEGDLAGAFAEGVRAVDLGPGIDYLWVNLGAIYRQAGQDDAAESMYLTALEINPDSRSAMNNLAVLYHARGELAQSRYWETLIEERQQVNPFYHYSLGEIAESEGDLEAALSHYLDAIALKESEAEFYYRVARLYLRQDQREDSRRYVMMAIERASLVTEREEYSDFLRELKSGEAMAARLEQG
jgi:Flp pilus assembly protein TadD